MTKNREILKILEKQNEEICNGIADYQNICIDELCDEYADIIFKARIMDNKENIVSLLCSLAGEIHKIYFE